MDALEFKPGAAQSSQTSPTSPGWSLSLPSPRLQLPGGGVRLAGKTLPGAAGHVLGAAMLLPGVTKPPPPKKSNTQVLAKAQVSYYSGLWKVSQHAFELVRNCC